MISDMETAPFEKEQKIWGPPDRAKPQGGRLKIGVYHIPQAPAFHSALYEVAFPPFRLNSSSLAINQNDSKSYLFKGKKMSGDTTWSIFD